MSDVAKGPQGQTSCDCSPEAPLAAGSPRGTTQGVREGSGEPGAQQPREERADKLGLGDSCVLCPNQEERGWGGLSGEEPWPAAWALGRLKDWGPGVH